MRIRQAIGAAAVGLSLVVTAWTGLAQAQDQSASAPAAPPASSSSSSTTSTSGGTSSTVQSILNGINSGQSPQTILNQIQQGQQPGAPPPSLQPTDQVLRAGPAGASPALEFSTLEGAYSAKLNRTINQFGYDLIGNGGSVSALQIGAIQDDYILGPGDTINVTLLGQQNASYSARIDRDGNVTFLNLAPISASGRRFGEFRRDLEAAIKRAYLQTQVFVSVGSVRQLSIRVVGEVANPGVYAVTGLSTVLDALNMAGGIKKSGTLRNIIVVRGAHSYSIDLYSMLLTHGPTPDMSVTQGDRIVVGPIGATAAITGDVRREAIFEMPRGQKTTTVREMLALSNGPRIRGVYRESLLRIRPDGKEELVDVTASPGVLVRDGEVVTVSKAVDASLGKVTLSGAVRLPGDYALNATHSLQQLLPNAEVFAPTPYMLLGVIKRLDPKTLTPTLIPFSPLHVLQKKENVELRSNDSVIILTMETMRSLANGSPLVDTNTPWAQGAGQPGQAPSGIPANLTANPLAMLTNPSTVPGAAAMGVAPPAGTTAPPAINPAAPVPVGTSAVPAAPSATAVDSSGLTAADSAFFGHTLAEYRVSVNGLRDSGVFLISPGTTLDEIVAAAGGLSGDTDLSAFEVTSVTIDNMTGQSTVSRKVYHIPPSDYASVVLKPRDSLVFHDVYSNADGGAVTVQGEVRYPGNFDILRGERLSSVLARAGGLTDASYPYGAVFTRASVAQQEGDAKAREADQLESDVAAYVSSGTLTADQAAYIKSVTDRLRNNQSTGRIAIEADPAVLAVKPQFDIVLQPGDHLIIPRRPASIAIMGEVLNAGSVLFDAKLSVSDYIKKAGGTTEMADTSKIFIVYPDGSASPANAEFWSFSDKKLAPGSTIVVPREITLPTNLIQLVTAISGVVRDLALSAASVAVIGKK